MSRCLPGRGRPAVVGLLLLTGAAAGLAVRDGLLPARGESPRAEASIPAAQKLTVRVSPDAPAVYAPDWDKPYPQYQPVGKVLQPLPSLKPGTCRPRTCRSSAAPAGRRSPPSTTSADFDEFYRMCAENKPRGHGRAAQVHGPALRLHRQAATSDVTMTRGKPIPVGPVVRLPEGIASLGGPGRPGAGDDPRSGTSSRSASARCRTRCNRSATSSSRRRGSRLHPEHERFDVDFDIPDAYLPEFPPPLFLTTRPDLGDVSRGPRDHPGQLPRAVRRDHHARSRWRGCDCW